MRPVFALVDANNFYVSCERIFDPTHPVIVLNNNDGCVVARSQEAKRIPGIRMGVPVFQIQHIIDREGVVAYSSNYELYGDMSEDILKQCQQDRNSNPGTRRLK